MVAEQIYNFYHVGGNSGGSEIPGEQQGDEQENQKVLLSTGCIFHHLSESDHI